MAMQLTIKMPTGVSILYHRIATLAIDYDNKVAIATVKSYISEEARKTGCDPVQVRTVAVPLPGLDVRAEVYAALSVPLPPPSMPPIPKPPYVDEATGETIIPPPPVLPPPVQVTGYNGAVEQ